MQEKVKGSVNCTAKSQHDEPLARKFENVLWPGVSINKSPGMLESTCSRRSMSAQEHYIVTCI
eukprot:759001-Hanusia_phi.AAC.3